MVFPSLFHFLCTQSQPTGEKTHSPPVLEYKPVTSCSPFRGLPLDQEQSLAVLRHLHRAVISFLQPRSYFSPLFCESCNSLYEAVTVSSFSNMKETYRNPPSSYIGLLAYFFKESISYCAKKNQWRLNIKINVQILISAHKIKAGNKPVSASSSSSSSSSFSLLLGASEIGIDLTLMEVRSLLSSCLLPSPSWCWGYRCVSPFWV